MKKILLSYLIVLSGVGCTTNEPKETPLEVKPKDTYCNPKAFFWNTVECRIVCILSSAKYRLLVGLFIFYLVYLRFNILSNYYDD